MVWGKLCSKNLRVCAWNQIHTVLLATKCDVYDNWFRFIDFILSARNRVNWGIRQWAMGFCRFVKSLNVGFKSELLRFFAKLNFFGVSVNFLTPVVIWLLMHLLPNIIFLTCRSSLCVVNGGLGSKLRINSCLFFESKFWLALLIHLTFFQK